MSIVIRLGCALVLAMAAAGAHAECVKNAQGKAICAPPQGGIAQIPGRVLCGTGQCVVEAGARVRCSSVPGGGAMLNPQGLATCVGGCEPGRRDACIVATR
jgi:hypothetical protein